MDIVFHTLTKQPDLATKLFSRADKTFNYYLGFDDGDAFAVCEVIHPDPAHEYWAVIIDSNLVGLAYYYGYAAKHMKCSIGIGILPEYRGKHLFKDIICDFCTFLENGYGVVRIQVDIENTNVTCLSAFSGILEETNFHFECEAENYWGPGVTCQIFSRTKCM